ncbi:TRAFAC clade GTPase domain-containing protein [Glutamicibacter arilaitensis]|uniref:TRAFAC clade GTPase domain-containing protein n=3 Tax=Glutamicibacter arilaitensis TaxID=256701 RepID=UPI003FCF753C
MSINKTKEQHIAVFGESGSGKTVMLSSFYGAAQEPKFTKDSLFHVVADEFGQGARLHKNYLGMRDESQVPMTNHFSSTSYSFTLKLKSANAQRSPVNALRLVWHDYPGEWFDSGVENDEEAARRLSTFKDLLQSDVALLLVDGQRLLDSKGEEERYLKSLIGNFKNSLLGLQDEILHDGKPLTKFPRIWMFGLSKCDLLPDFDAVRFHELLIHKVASEIEEFRNILTTFTTGDAALSVGEDFVLLSSAKFEPGKIELEDRVGIDLVLPIASALPLLRHLRWAKTLNLPGKVAKELLGGVSFALGILQRHQNKLPAPLAMVVNKVKPEMLLGIADLATSALEEIMKNALAKNDHIAAILAGFQIKLNKAEENKILIRSKR